MIIEDMRADYHRNGVGGEGSYVAMFRVTSATDHFLPHLLEPLKEAMNQHYAIIRGRFTRRETATSKPS